MVGARAAYTPAERAYHVELAGWQAEQDRLDTLVAVARATLRDRGRTDFGVVLKSNESALFGCEGQLIEPRKLRGHYSGRSSGISVRIARGVWYRTGSYRGTYIPGPELQTPIDVGRAVITTTRVIFTGWKATREWRFDKLVGIDADADFGTVLIHVQNRQKVSGLLLAGATVAFQTNLEVALTIADRGVDAAIQELKAAADAHMSGQPQPPRSP
ncbi:hypothetical protein ACFVVM_19205 [Nocardia sp. NPDC058176]|uniref:hypothetical protein n=1 Tax=Nocardia sp. NPDC058176 TaxID=3346368 RepID=UPI0036DE4F95